MAEIEYKNIDYDVSIRIKSIIKVNGFNLFLVAYLMGELPLPTLKQKLSGNGKWKLSEIASFAHYTGITTDEIIFGDADYIKKINKAVIAETKTKIKEYLIKEKQFKTYGALQASGYFKEIE